MGKKSTPKAPAAPDPVKTAAAQAELNTKSAITQANLNRIDQVTPQGTLTYTQTGTNADGTPKYTQTQAYSPEQQNLYNQEVQVDSGLNQLAVNNLGRVADVQSKPFTFDGMTPTSAVSSNANNIQTGLDYSGVSAMPTGDSFDATSKAAADAVYNQAASRLDPQYAQLEAQERNRLINSGISENSQAYRTALDNFGRSRSDAYNQANYSSIAAGLAAQDQGFDQALQSRQQGVSEVNQQGAFRNTAANQQYNTNLSAANQNNTVRQQQIQEASYLRNLPINDIAALLGTGGSVSNPEFQSFSQVGVAAPDYQGAVYQNYNAANQQYQAAQQARSQGLGSIFGLAGSLGAAAISDRRLKHSIKRVGELANGIATYVYSYKGSAKRHFGVMAQEVQQRLPDAVGQLSDGTMFVNYRKVWGNAAAA